MIGNLQILRAFAASGVVVYHTNAVIAGVHTEFHGVALFFVLSGYLMCKISDRSALDFARDRIWRIVPNYWVSMAALLTIFTMWTYWPLEHTLLSAFFIPHASIAGLFPVLGVGWTLNLEMYFYAVFTLSIIINQSKAPIIAGAIILALMGGLPYITGNKAILYYYTHGYVKYFVFGIAIWYISEWIKSKYTTLRLPFWTFPVSLSAYVAATLYAVNPVFAVPSLFMAAILASNSCADLKPRAIMLMGDASYSCYLLHTIFIEFLRHTGIAINGTFLCSLGILIGSWVIAIIWHIYIEENVSILRHRTSRKSLKANILYLLNRAIPASRS
ncbi:acyltransferase family protein [Syntrophus aciditrophicus]|uniref:Polysaccharide acetyltransferase n=1 Tax=Syntrophus aciditrophicus (strain SB) TaxID=56780 RepID=Q2LQT2_SYNAS|nr:acyltransferase [Syntrophus aciditrophicus]ABC76445.1 polysaccharide acetyltransferase [Syntrophus aciditrophicus SB]